VDNGTILKRAESRAAFLRTWSMAWRHRVMVMEILPVDPRRQVVNGLNYEATEAIIRAGLEALSPEAAR